MVHNCNFLNNIGIIINKNIFTMELFDINYNEVLDAYFECALWIADEDDKELREKTIFDFSESAIERSMMDVLFFLDEAEKTAKEELLTYNSEMIGHNLWLSRNGHGAGFFDDNCDTLQDIARKMKTVDVVLGDNGKVYIE